MAIPGALMPGQGGPPPPGAGMDPMGGGPDAILKLLSSFQQAAQPSGEEQMLQQASLMINGAYARIAPRSAEAARALAQANVNIQTALQKLKAEPTRPLPGPPDLMGGMSPGGGLGM